MKENSRVVIFSSIQSARLDFVLDTIFRQRLKTDYILTDQYADIEKTDTVIEYNFRKISDFHFIQAHEIIVQDFVDKEFKPKYSGEKGEFKIFPLQNSFLGFDIFSAIFYCLSLYDAYTQTKFDRHKRIIFKQWFPRISGLDQMPYVEIWIEQLKLFLEKSGIECSENSFVQDISFDIDHFYLLDQRPLLQHIKASLKDLFKLRFFHLFQRWMVILGLTQDPAEKFFNLLEYQNENTFRFFILMKQGRHNSLNPLNDLKKSLINKLKKHGEIALHPSYESFSKTDSIQSEKNQLSQIIHYFITVSRFHFLRIHFPNSFYALNKYGIKTDQSIGYYDQPGFMASTTIPFNFFNPVKNERLELQLQPFVWMDSMNKYYRLMDDKKEKEEIHQLKELVKQHKGNFFVVFHNDSMVERRYRMLLKSLLYN